MTPDLTQALRGVNGGGLLLYRFSFSPAGAAAPTLVGGKFVKSITRSNTGLFLVTMTASFAAVYDVHGDVRDTGGGGLVACMGVQYDPTLSTLSPTNPNVAGSVLAIRTVNSAGANTDFTANTVGSSIDVVLLLSNGDDPSNLT
jgi:hypothetical protein